jgi:4-carboxymuconolactone decarboxylase
MESLPRPFQRFTHQFPEVARAYEELGKASHVRGPLPPTTRQLVKLGMAIASQREGAVHSHTRRALEVGVTAEEIYHVILMSITSIGFGAAMAAFTWVNDILDHPE